MQFCILHLCLCTTRGIRVLRKVCLNLLEAWRPKHHFFTHLLPSRILKQCFWGRMWNNSSLQFFSTVHEWTDIHNENSTIEQQNYLQQMICQMSTTEINKIWEPNNQPTQRFDLGSVNKNPTFQSQQTLAGKRPQVAQSLQALSNSTK